MSDVIEKVCKAVLDLIKQGDMAFEKIKISDIAKKADIGKGTVYEYFKSKEQVITESLLYVMREFGGVFDSPGKTRDEDFREGLIGIIKDIFSFMEDNRKLSYMLFTGDSHLALSCDMKNIIMTEITDIRSRVSTYFNVLFENGKKEGISTGDLNSISRIIAEQALLSSIMYYFHHDMKQSANNKDEFIDSIYDAVVKILS